MKIQIAILVAMLCSGCRDDQYSMADDKALCDPQTGAAFIVQRGAGDISFVKRNQALDKLCAGQKG